MCMPCKRSEVVDLARIKGVSLFVAKGGDCTCSTMSMSNMLTPASVLTAD